MSLPRACSRSLVLPALLFLSACSGLVQTGGEPAPVEDRPDGSIAAPPPPTEPPPVTHKPASPSASSAWKPLLAEADQCAGRGDYERALALLERAQRIDPDSAEVYLGMARTHSARGDDAQARAVAERGLLYCSTASQCEALRRYTR